MTRCKKCMAWQDECFCWELEDEGVDVEAINQEEDMRDYYKSLNIQ